MQSIQTESNALCTEESLARVCETDFASFAIFLQISYKLLRITSTFGKHVSFSLSRYNPFFCDSWNFSVFVICCLLIKKIIFFSSCSFRLGIAKSQTLDCPPPLHFWPWWCIKPKSAWLAPNALYQGFQMHSASILWNCSYTTSLQSSFVLVKIQTGFITKQVETQWYPKNILRYFQNVTSCVKWF